MNELLARNHISNICGCRTTHTYCDCDATLLQDVLNSWNKDTQPFVPLLNPEYMAHMGIVNEYLVHHKGSLKFIIRTHQFADVFRAITREFDVFDVVYWVYKDSIDVRIAHENGTICYIITKSNQ